MDLKKRRVQPDDAAHFIVVEVVSASSALAEIAGRAMAFRQWPFSNDLSAMVFKDGEQTFSRAPAEFRHPTRRPSNTIRRLAQLPRQRMSRNGSAPQCVDRVSRENTDTRQTQHGNQKFNHRRRPWRPATDTTLQRSCTVKGKACSGTVLVGSDASLHQLTSVERAVAVR
jgi:hypothetical protein